MKIAICFFGQVKNYNDRLYHSFTNHVLKSLQQYSSQFDYFLVTYNNTHYVNPRHNEDHSIDYTSIFPYFNWSEKFILDNKSIEINRVDQFALELIEKFGSGWGSPFDPILSMLAAIRQLYGLNILYQNICNKYDAYCLVRPDSLFTNDLILTTNTNIDYDIMLPNFATWGGYNDRFAVIKSESGLWNYCNRFTYLYHKPQYYNSESYLKQILSQHNMYVYKIPDFRFQLMRANNILTNKDY